MSVPVKCRGLYLEVRCNGKQYAATAVADGQCCSRLCRVCLCRLQGASPGGMRRAKVPTLPFIIDLTWGDPTVMHTHTDTTSTAQNGRGGHDTQQSGSAGGHDTQQSPSPAASVTQQSSRAGGGVEGHDTQKGASNGVDGAQQGGAGGAGLSGAQEDDGTGVCDTQEQCVDCVDLALIVLRACEELRATQALYAGPGHYDTLRTLLDTQVCAVHTHTHTHTHTL